MKNFIPIIRFNAMILICGLILFSCKKKDIDSPAPEGTHATSSLDTLANHFKFAGSHKIEGKIPTAPAISTLKFSIQDTLRLVPGVYIPISFLHDKSSNVSGIFIQVSDKVNDASFYYDVPELPDVADVDTISVIMIQYNPSNLPDELPLYFDVKIAPYDKNGQLMDETTVPVKVENLSDVANGKSNKNAKSQNVSNCDLTGGYWVWRASYIPSKKNDGSFEFYNDPYKTWGKSGQEIWGSCCGGTSIYGPCPGEREPNTSLVFYTYSQYKKETFIFYDASYTRNTIHASAVPLPDLTNFCRDEIGLVEEGISSVDYKGDLIITEVTVPDYLHVYYDKRNKLILSQTSSNPALGGYGNPGGIIHVLTCEILVLIQIDPEGTGMDLIKIYYHTYNGVTQKWFTLHVMG